MATEHTATPWCVGDRNETRGVPILAGTDAETVRITAVYGSDALPDSQDEVNADFIVRACNAHDALVAAAKNALDKIFNDGARREGWVEIQTSALADLRTALKSAE